MAVDRGPDLRLLRLEERLGRVPLQGPGPSEPEEGRKVAESHSELNDVQKYWCVKLKLKNCFIICILFDEKY